MLKITVTYILFSLAVSGAYGQESGNKRTLSAEETKNLLIQLNIDSAKMFRESEQSTCKCIDSLSTSEKDVNDMAKDISGCISQGVETYMLSLQMMNALKTNGNNKIVLNADKDSREYRKYYYDMERWLKDSCSSLTKKMSSNEKLSDLSGSTNSEAIRLYNAGNKLIEKEDYEKALPYFKKATEVDPQFAFAWDNLGVCNRRTGNWDEAIAAYRKSLAIDPRGLTPLHNLPVAYELKKDYDNALAEYKNIAKIYPDDPEALYGAGRVLIFYKEDLEGGLDYMCKAYNAYVSVSSPYRVDAEKNISYIFSKMKLAGKEDQFFKILKDNKISPSKN